LDVGLLRRDLSGLGWGEPDGRKSGPVESRPRDWRVRIRGSAMPAIVLSRAAAARARRPSDFCELVEGVLRWWVRRLVEAIEDGDEIEVVLVWVCVWVWVGDSGPSEDGEGEGEGCGASEGS
jgi:hypothetical protein